MSELTLEDLRFKGKRELLRNDFRPIEAIGGKFLCILTEDAAQSVFASIQRTFGSGSILARTINGKPVTDLVYGFTVVMPAVAKALGYEIEPNAVVGMDSGGSTHAVLVD